MYERDKKRCRCRQVDNGIQDENGRERLNDLPLRAKGGNVGHERATILHARRPILSSSLASLSRDKLNKRLNMTASHRGCRCTAYIAISRSQTIQ